MPTLANLLENSEFLNLFNFKLTLSNLAITPVFITEQNEIVHFPLYKITGNTIEKYNRIIKDVYSIIGATIQDAREDIFIWENSKDITLSIHLVDENYVAMLAMYEGVKEIPIIEAAIKRSPLIKFIVRSACFDKTIQGNYGTDNQHRICYQLDVNIDEISKIAIEELAEHILLSKQEFYQTRDLSTVCYTQLRFNVEVKNTNNQRILYIYYQINNEEKE